MTTKETTPKTHKTTVKHKVVHKKEVPKTIHTVKKDSLKNGYIQTVGRRKRSIARLRLIANGTGVYTINDKAYDVYFPYQLWKQTVTEPLPLVGMDKKVDISVKVLGGGVQGQAEAIRLALARALLIHNEDWRPLLRKMGWLTRDPRIKERKKPGLKRARRAPQWQKR